MAPIPKGPNACGTLFALKSRMNYLGRTSTQAYYNLETAISYLSGLNDKIVTCNSPE
jgi:hypothetical protein